MNFLKIVVVLMLTTLNVGLCLAQSNTTTHVVERGETLASIAKRYSTTEAEIIKLNPDAAQFVYVGMELVMPATVETKQIDKTIEHANSSNTANQTSKEELSQIHNNKDNVSDFGFYGISYLAPFEDAGKGYYMFGGEVFYDSGWGIDWQFGFNFGLVDKDIAGGAFLLGPAYGYAYNNIFLSTSLDFIGTYSGTGKSQKTKTNAKGEKISYLGGDSKFNWGIALMPKVAIKLGSVMPWIGINVQWAKGADKLYVGFQIGVGFN